MIYLCVYLLLKIHFNYQAHNIIMVLNNTTIQVFNCEWIINSIRNLHISTPPTFAACLHHHTALLEPNPNPVTMCFYFLIIIASVKRYVTPK